MDTGDSSNSLQSIIKPGSKVRLKRNPTRIGVVGNEFSGEGRRQRVVVTFVEPLEEEEVLLSELEPVEQKNNTPTACIRDNRYASAINLRTAITHHRLSGRLANLIYSLNTTNTDFLAYQFKPVLQFLDSPSNGILIADEVGLGKTIEAGLIWTELRARMDARRLLVVCPAVLREKWRDELLNRFGVKADIVDADELLKRVQSVQQKPRQEFALIASLQGIRPPANYEDVGNKQSAAVLARFLSDFEQGSDPLLHLTIFDEAHYLRNPETSTHQLGRLLRPLTDQIVMLSATPIQLGSEDLFNLLRILDESAYPNEHLFEKSMKVTRPIVQLRDQVLAGKIRQKAFCIELENAMQSEFLADSTQLAALLKNPPSDADLKDVRMRSEIADRLDRVHPLSKIVTRTLKREVQENRVVRKPFPMKAPLSDVEREFYDRVTELVRDYCHENEMLTGFLLTVPQRQMSSSMPAACRAWQERLSTGKTKGMDEALYELSGYEESEADRADEPGELVKALVAIANDIGNYELLKKHDGKYQLLISNIKSYRKENPGKKIVLFSFFRQTLDYLHERLAEDGVVSVVLKGGLDKQAILQRFKEADGPEILLSSEVASEGVDLQFSSLLVNYDLPWNPARIEQRIGRIDRIGQKAERILIWNLMYQDTIDERIYDRLLERLDIFRQSLGSMESVLGKEITRMTSDLFKHRLTKREEERRIDQTQLAIEEQNRRQKMLEEEAPNLVAHGDFIINKVRAAKELGRFICGEDLYVYASDFLVERYDGTRFIQIEQDDLQYEFVPSIHLRSELSEFLVRGDLRGTTQILSQRPQPLLFDNCHGHSSVHCERVTQDHPLIRFVTYKLGDFEHYQSRYPVSAVRLNSDVVKGIPPGDYVFAVHRWSFSGAKVQERLEYCAKPFRESHSLSGEVAEKLVNVAALRGEDWFSVPNEVESNEVLDAFVDCRSSLSYIFDCNRKAIEDENKDTINLNRRLLEDRYRSEVERIDARIEYLKSSGKERMVVPEMGKKNKAKKRLDERLADLSLKEQLKAEEKLVTGGVIRIY